MNDNQGGGGVIYQIKYSKLSKQNFKIYLYYEK